MKKKLNVVILFCIFIACLLVGCSGGNKTYNYFGESKHWEGRYTLNQDSDTFGITKEEAMNMLKTFNVLQGTKTQ